MKQGILILVMMPLLLQSAGAMASGSLQDRPAVDADRFSAASGIPHPRLFLKEGEEKAVQEAVDAYPVVKTMHGTVMEWADAALTQAPLTRRVIGIRLLDTSRESLKRVFALSYAYRMTGKQCYAGRAEQEMLACCAFSDWNPSHFLDVAEMAMSMAIGYDWLYDVLSPQTLVTVRQAIVEKAFGPVFKDKQPWYDYTSNWNSVCNAGMTVAALALYEHEPELCSEIISRSLASNPKALAVYAPDGGYPEGAMYWSYGSCFEIMMISALESACGTDFGLAGFPGFLESGRFMQAMQTPRGGCWNYSDANYASYCNPILFWVAQRTGDPALLYTEMTLAGKKPYLEERILPFAVISASKMDMDKVVPPDWNTWFSRGITPVFAYRSGWESAGDTYFGIKGGTPSSGHSHMDGGSFIYERDSVRWALDLGMQDYHSLEKYGLDIWSTAQDSDRWKVFRYVNISHNTISVLDSLHRSSGKAEIVRTFASGSRKGAVVDLTSILPQFRKATRTAVLDRKDRLRIEDRIVTGKEPETLVWMMNTEAVPEIVSNDEILLTCRGHEMRVKFDATSAFRLEIFPNTPVAEYDTANPGTVRIGLVMDVREESRETVTARFY